MSREEVYNIIDSERDYQQQKWPGHTHSLTEYLVYIKDYVEEALHKQSREHYIQANEFTQDSMRKIAALAVAAMEEHESRNRE